MYQPVFNTPLDYIAGEAPRGPVLDHDDLVVDTADNLDMEDSVATTRIDATPRDEVRPVQPWPQLQWRFAVLASPSRQRILRVAR
jgi:hypothetical protein